MKVRVVVERLEESWYEVEVPDDTDWDALDTITVESDLVAEVFGENNTPVFVDWPEADVVRITTLPLEPNAVTDLWRNDEGRG